MHGRKGVEGKKEENRKTEQIFTLKELEELRQKVSSFIVLQIKKPVL